MPNVFNITAPTVVKASGGALIDVSVLVAGTTAGSTNDCLTTGAAAITNQVTPIPDIIGTYRVESTHITGICIVPGTGQTLRVFYF